MPASKASALEGVYSSRVFFNNSTAYVGETNLV
jgi:hypothetical protein